MIPSVSIVCVSHKRQELLLRCLASCVEQDYPVLEILVLLNPAQPEAESIIRDRFPHVRILRTHRNLGFFPALNVAIANTDGDYVMTVDDDAHFMQRDAITRLVEAFAEEPELGAVTCNLEGPTETLVEGPDRYIRVFTTGFTMLPRAVFSEWVGYYPDVFFRSAGETYVAMTLWDRGKRVKRLTGVKMYHARTMTGRSDRDWKFYGLRSQILCTVMRDPMRVLVPSLLSKAVKSFVSYVRWGHVITWFHAWGSGMLHLPEALALRRPIRYSTWRLLRRMDAAVDGGPASPEAIPGNAVRDEPLSDVRHTRMD